MRAASGRLRLNVLGARDAISRRLLAVTNTTVVNSEMMCELLRKIAAEKLVGPITIVLDNARYQRNQMVHDLAAQLGIRLYFQPSYSPNLNLIERLWGFAKRQSVYEKYLANFASFQAAIGVTLAALSTTHANKLKAENLDDAELSRIPRRPITDRVGYNGIDVSYVLRASRCNIPAKSQS